MVKYANISKELSIYWIRLDRKRREFFLFPVSVEIVNRGSKSYVRGVQLSRGWSAEVTGADLNLRLASFLPVDPYTLIKDHVCKS